MRRCLLVLPFVLMAAPACAQDNGFCVDRPGLATPPCTLPPGHVMVELGLVDWDHSADPASVEDDMTYGNVLVGVGINDRTELWAGLGGYGTTRSRDRLSGTMTRTEGLGDLSLGLRRNLSGPDGRVALQLSLSLPTGRSGIGAGDWGAQLMLPMAYQLPTGFELDLSPELDAAVNSSGSGRHLAWGAVVGLEHGVGPNLSLSAEIGAWCDQDPAGHATDVRGAVSLAWRAGRDWQFDIEADAGLTAAAPRHSLMVGLARRF